MNTTQNAQAGSLKRAVRRLEAENVMLKNHNGQLNAMLDAWYAAFGTNQLTHALARIEAAEKRAAKSPNDPSSATGLGGNDPSQERKTQ